MGKIFDKKKIEEQQELANLFGQIAFEEVHKISKVHGWDEASPQKKALHAFVGGIMSQITGSGFKSGAVGAGVNEAVQKELEKRFKNQPDMWQWASALIGAAAAKAVGGDAQAGASTAASGTKNNAELLLEEAIKIKAIRNTERADMFEALNEDLNVWRDMYNTGQISEQAWEFIQDDYNNKYNKIYYATSNDIDLSGDAIGNMLTGFGGIPGMVLGDVVFSPGTAEASSRGQIEVENLLQDTEFLNKFLNYGTRSEQYVYVLEDPNTHEVKYVGRSVDPDARYQQHMNGNDEAKKGLQLRVITKDPVSFAEGRGLEQYLYEQYGGKDMLLNKIRPVNTDKTWGQFLQNLGAEAFERLNLRL